MMSGILLSLSSFFFVRSSFGFGFVPGAARLRPPTAASNPSAPPHYHHPHPRSDNDRIHELVTLFARKSIRLGGFGLGLVAAAVTSDADPSPALADAEEPAKGFQTKTGLRYFDRLEGTGVQPRYGTAYVLRRSDSVLSLPSHLSIYLLLLLPLHISSSSFSPSSSLLSCRCYIGQLVAFQYVMYYRPTGGKPEVVDKTSEPFLHKHGNGRLCRGLDEAIHTMKLGGKRRAIIPKSLGECTLPY